MLFPEESVRPTAKADPVWEKHWAASDRLIAEGMETWDLHRVNGEIEERNGGEREVP